MRSFLKSGISRRLFIGFAAVFAILIISIVSSNRNTNRIIKSEDMIIHTHKVLSELADVEINLLKLETGQRGFVITGKSKYLEPYHESLLTVEEMKIREQAEFQLHETMGRLRESEALLKESNSTKDKFFSIIAHDLRAPFTSLLGFTGLLNESFDNLEHSKAKKYIESINTGLEETYALLDNLLLWSRKQRGKIDFNPQKEDLFLLCCRIEGAIQLMANAKSIQIVKQVPPGVSVYADKVLFSVVLHNLLSNAIKFTPENGLVKITGEIQGDEAGKNYALIKVIDYGLGIPDEHQSSLFDLGKEQSTPGTNNEKGTGLGLVLCKDFVSMHKGEIGFESKEGQGSTFFFTIPCA